MSPVPQAEQYQPDRTHQTLLRISEHLNSSLEPEELLDTLVLEAIAVSGARSGVAGLRTAEGMTCRKYVLDGKEVPLQYTWPPGHGLPGWLIDHKVPYCTNDAQSDPQIVAELCGQFGVHSALSTPVLSTKGEPLAFFEVHNKEGGFTPSDQQNLLAVAHCAAIAIQNALAYERLRQTEHTLRETEERFQKFMEHLPGLAWIKDAGGRYVYANSAATRAFGTSREHLYGRTDSDVFPPETAALFRANDEQARLLHSGIQTIEILQHDDGLHHSIVRKFPIPAAVGQDHLVGGIAIDITDRIKAEEALRASEQRYRAVVESQAEMVARFRIDGAIVFANQAYAMAMGESVESLLKRNFWDFIPPEDQAAVRLQLEALTPEHPEVRIENRIQLAAGERWTLWTNRALKFDAQGRVVEAQSTGIDITDRKAAETELQRANAALQHANEVLAGANQDLERFAFMASHDLQEPLRMVTAYSELLLRPGGSDETKAAFTSHIRAGTRRMRDLLADLLAYTEIRTRREENSEIVDLNVLIDGVKQTLEDTIRETGATITSAALPKLRANRLHVQSILYNFISNALKYRSSRPPVIEISARQDGPDVRLQVRDNGLGIEAEFQAQIFEAFRRLHGSQIPGTGIGLAICQRVVEKWGGKIGVESSPGKGSTFWFTVPRSLVVDPGETP